MRRYIQRDRLTGPCFFAKSGPGSVVRAEPLHGLACKKAPDFLSPVAQIFIYLFMKGPPTRRTASWLHILATELVQRAS
jgi:hypothetical protein